MQTVVKATLLTESDAWPTREQKKNKSKENDGSTETVTNNCEVIYRDMINL